MSQKRGDVFEVFEMMNPIPKNRRHVMEREVIRLKLKTPNTSKLGRKSLFTKVFKHV